MDWGSFSNYLERDSREYLLLSANINGQRDVTIHSADDYYETVYQWWGNKTDEQKIDAIHEYRMEYYGKPEFDLEMHNNEAPDDWYRLLYLTGLRSMGRVTPRANIEFVENFMQTFNFRELSFGNSDSLEDWMRYIVLEPMKRHSNGDYEEWRKYLPMFAQISLGAKDLYEIFADAQEDVSKGYRRLLDFSNLPESSGPDKKLANLDHALGKYYPLILLELLSNETRAKTFDSKTTKQMISECFYPTRTMREKQLGETPEMFYERWKEEVEDNLYRHRFMHHYAYPFYCYENKDQNEDNIFDEDEVD